MVPGVLPTDPELTGNPASKSGLNYADEDGDSGVSRDNFYYIDGINVTDGATGKFGANLNTEVIQEQKVLTGGIPSEFIGAPGLVSNVVLKSGSNAFHGSVNYFFQNDSLVAKDKNAPDQTFSRYDTAFTLGGPIFQDKAWFFGSLRRLKRTDSIAALDNPDEILREPETTETQGYARGTWSPTSNDTVSFTFLNDPLDRTGSPLRNISNTRDLTREAGGNRYNVTYSRMFGMDVLVDVAYNQHEGRLDELALLRESQNDVIFRGTDDRTLEQEQMGGEEEDEFTSRDTKTFKAGFNWNVEQHTVKAGVILGENRLFLNELLNGDNSFNSFANHLSGLTMEQFESGVFSDSTWESRNPSDYNGFIGEINGLSNRDAFYGAYDTDGNGTITPEELAENMVFDSTSGNPHGAVNYGRTSQVQDGPQDYKAESIQFYVQDSFQMGDWVFNAGVRTERYEHFASDNTTSIYTFPWTFGPRLSAVYDVKGDGSQKISAFYGRYFDPIRTNMTSFAGQLTGNIRHEQVWAGGGGLGQWVTYRVRGGAQNPDAFFAPTTKTPWTEDIQIGYEIQLADDMSFETVFTKRRTRDILEDYDMSIYTFRDDGSTNYPGDPDHPDSLFLGLDYFGYSSFPESNFVIATLAGAERNYKGLEFIFRKRYSDNYQFYASYTWNNMDGNSNSDSNADLQGDLLELDPRAPGNFGDQPGSIRHLMKFGGSYLFDMGLEVGGGVLWNSGTVSSLTRKQYGRNLPLLVPAGEEFEFAGFENRWLEPGNVGILTNPSWAEANLRVQYHINRGGAVGAQVFADVFNVFNNQNASRSQDLLAGTGSTAFGEGIKFIKPSRLFLGVRLIF